MKKRIRKRMIAVLSIIGIMSFRSLSALVSDNDGSAFVTKAEFESLKNNFIKQLNEYNKSIDNKIDGAIILQK